MSASTVRCVVNLPGWRWARITQLALVGSSSSLHSEVCNIPGFLFGDATAKFLGEATKRTVAVANLQIFGRIRMFCQVANEGDHWYLIMHPCGRGNSVVSDT